MKKYDNQGIALIETRTKDQSEKKYYDVVITSRFDRLQAYSLDEKELAKVSEALQILDDKRFGRVK